jgi:hypothetical protein
LAIRKMSTNLALEFPVIAGILLVIVDTKTVHMFKVETIGAHLDKCFVCISPFFSPLFDYQIRQIWIIMFKIPTKEKAPM